MGCELSKLAGGSGGGCSKGNVPSLDACGPPPTDSRLPLTAKQKYTMVASWKGISRAMETTGIDMFIKLFEEHAELIDLFAKFKDLKTKEEQAMSEELAEHANKVMTTLDEGIRGLDDMDTFFEFIHQVGASHRRIPGFKQEYFWKIEEPFLSAVSNTLGDRYTQNVEGIYKLTIKFIIENLIAGYETSANNNENVNNANLSTSSATAAGTGSTNSKKTS
ncbi:neuroglobin-like [Topomyia yanbarensis]|uniref:neuroglobin-like n=1 Tax=Topomyia yanbarensis TaxID=2498891 RepID=UPI00273BE405|nr:neuroglobin-like [Topomyia yanbarensis]XP_058835998.1 neuroglobin-like [Topomyia yanbarensis]XP_058835999.1 neuroglobin-like [Topomyia yanbarensis]XP_058836000.1 neuroglobin-like [Topomyia yanbarensis]XP_058836001.1 neuroglobin-like [Topomyia yanbarensis]XP_058836002.1 neuroglobin-like [Topomyia yanbarensis]XP_058836003.1 neuroglobin-like [Topomyia yanbarensis]XP_058836004.1 neuroglobin-like [Topomyia yanbarensis]XP_058836005.1 neuroglobin-like [Topomyia yanbarensis]XP_058836006.1 neuro